jgi:3-(3-hydroxy-phenyl)propionate hydroxylase
MQKKHIVIAGAGPVGVVSALACAQRGFTVTLLEAEDKIDTSPRAATTHSSTLEMIDQVGLIDRFTREGLVARYFDFWDQPSRSRIARFDHDILKDETKFPYVVQTEQHKLAKMGIEKLAEYPDASVRFSTRLTGLVQDGNGVTVTVQNKDGEEEHLRADYVIASDGGRSTVRKLLDIAFEGITFPERFVVITVFDDFEKMMDCCFRNYLADPKEWGNLFKVSGEDGKARWRAVFPSRQDETDEEALADEAVFRRLQKIHPLPGGYDIAHRNVYRVHQRVAATFRQGRVFLAGDSAHLNNPIGGLGLNSGIHDAMELSETLFDVAYDGADAALLDRYERRRRLLNIEFVQQQTIANKKRLEEQDPVKRAMALDELRVTSEDPAKHKQFLLRSSLIESVRKSKSMA